MRSPLTSAASLVLALALAAGCGGEPAATSTPTPVATNRAAAPGTEGAVPAEITTLTTEREVYDCPKCDMVFDRAGMCTMCHVDLVHSRVDYSCAVDQQPVEQAGRCPRCPQDAVVTITPLASNLVAPGQP